MDTSENIDKPLQRKLKILKYKDSYIEYGLIYLYETGKNVA